MGAIIAINDSEVAGYVIELGGGYRIRFAIDDWERLRLYRGQRVPVQIPGTEEVCLFVSEVVEIPPVAWVVLEKRFREWAA